MRRELQSWMLGSVVRVVQTILVHAFDHDAVHICDTFLGALGEQIVEVSNHAVS